MREEKKIEEKERERERERNDGEHRHLKVSFVADSPGKQHGTLVLRCGGW